MKNIAFLLLGLLIAGGVSWYLTSISYSAELRANYMTKRGVSVQRDFHLMALAARENLGVEAKLISRLCSDIEFLYSINDGTVDWGKWYVTDPVSQQYAKEQARDYLLVPDAPGTGAFYESRCQ
jgi:hypothetical protein